MSDTPETDHLENELGTAAGMSHPTLWAFARTLERERDEARKKADTMFAKYADIIDETRSERDDAIKMMKRTKDNSGKIIASKVVENIILTQQRDWLAKILQNIRSGYGIQFPDPDCYCGDCDFLIEIDTALQFLTPKKQ